jgi:hypothetical protein
MPCQRPLQCVKDQAQHANPLLLELMPNPRKSKACQWEELTASSQYLALCLMPSSSSDFSTIQRR